jgi:hypothetical protein
MNSEVGKYCTGSSVAALLQLDIPGLCLGGWKLAPENDAVLALLRCIGGREPLNDFIISHHDLFVSSLCT